MISPLQRMIKVRTAQLTAHGPYETRPQEYHTVHKIQYVLTLSSSLKQVDDLVEDIILRTNIKGYDFTQRIINNSAWNYYDSIIVYSIGIT
jgi:hypothetical protein